jgi:ParB-like chromosome segregation protein Spo0J
MRKSRIENQVSSIEIEKLHAHPDNPNKMSRDTFTKLVRNIERTGRYEPIVIRQKENAWQILNGHHRVKALKQLGQKEADCLIWDVDDNEAGILLATLNRLGGSDTLDKKLELLKRLNERMHSRELAKLLPQTARQIERLTNLKLPAAPAKAGTNRFLNPVTFFVNNNQYKTIRQALELAADSKDGKTNPSTTLRTKPTKAQRNAAALTRIAESFLETQNAYPCHSEAKPKNPAGEKEVGNVT